MLQVTQHAPQMDSCHLLPASGPLCMSIKMQAGRLLHSTARALGADLHVQNSPFTNGMCFDPCDAQQ